jgi:hypothetical protein
LPDYNFKENESTGTPVSGIIGGIFVFLFIAVMGFLIRIIKKYGMKTEAHR